MVTGGEKQVSVVQDGKKENTLKFPSIEICLLTLFEINLSY